LTTRASASPVLVERFRGKVKILSRLKHPGLVTAYDAGQMGDVYYLVMEHVEGQDLHSVVKQRGPLPVEQAVRYVIEAAAALAYAHGFGVYHRNVKPSNLLLDVRGSIRVIGLGIARVEPKGAFGKEAVAGRLTRSGRVLGTPQYMAPEQAADPRSVDGRADVYSLGYTLHALLTGRPPYAGRSAIQQVVAHRDHPIPSIRARRPEVSLSLDAVFHRAIAKRPENRLQTMDDLLAALRAC